MFLLSEFSEEDEEEDDEVLKLDVETKTFSQDIQVRIPCPPPPPRDAPVKLCSLRPWQQEDGSAVVKCTANEGPVRFQCKCLVPFMYCIPKNETVQPRCFPKQTYNVLSPSSYIYVSVRDLYIPRIGLPILLQPNRLDSILGILYINRIRNVGIGPKHAVSRLEKHKSDFLYSAWWYPSEI